MHAPRQEYFDWLQGPFASRTSTRSVRRLFYNRFVAGWPELPAWFDEPLLVRLGLQDRALRETGKRAGPSSDAGSYISYLSLVRGVRLDADYVLSRNWESLFHPRVAPALGVDLDLLDAHTARMRQLGYRAGGASRSALTWALARLALWRGDPDTTTVSHDELLEFGELIRGYCRRPDAGFIRASLVHGARSGQDPQVLADQFGKACRARLHTLHVLLFNIDQVAAPPRRDLRRDDLWREQLVPPGTAPGLAAPIERWLALRLHSSDRAGSVRQARDAFRYLLRWLATTCPEVTSLDQLTREHLETYLGWLHDYLNPRSGQPLAVQTRYTYLSPLLQFFRETSDWGWDGVPARRLLSRSDLPKLPVRLPRYIPRDQLDPLMAAVEQLPDPYQRTALLLLRWSGARRGEIARLTLDCLDAYPDGHPRLRIPVGKTYTERSVPLHPEAANALRELIAHVRGTETVAWQDHTAEATVQFVFVRRGQPLGRHFLFTDPLATACKQVGLIDSRGRATVTAHRFRHTVGTQLAEGGARIQTIMAILGHSNAQMSAYYSKVSDPVVKEQYEQIIAAGGRVAGPAAEAVLTNRLDAETVYWLKTNYLKTELELGHCLRLPQEGPCECDLYLRCTKFFTTSDYIPRLRARLAVEQQLVQDAVERGWAREVERHSTVLDRLRDLLTKLGGLDEQTD